MLSLFCSVIPCEYYSMQGINERLPQGCQHSLLSSPVMLYPGANTYPSGWPHHAGQDGTSARTGFTCSLCFPALRFCSNVTFSGALFK